MCVFSVCVSRVFSLCFPVSRVFLCVFFLCFFYCAIFLCEYSAVCFGPCSFPVNYYSMFFALFYAFYVFLLWVSSSVCDFLVGVSFLCVIFLCVMCYCDLPCMYVFFFLCVFSSVFFCVCFSQEFCLCMFFSVFSVPVRFFLCFLYVFLPVCVFFPVSPV